MGIGRAAVALLLEEAATRPFVGSLATLGRQTISATDQEVAKQLARFGFPPPARAQEGPLDDQTLFRMMGFASVESIDYSDFEGATHCLDLNADQIPAALAGRFDVVLDSGTIEHVFHIPNALKNVLALAKEGGRVIFLSPSSNHVDHGFYMFSPTLFMDYLVTNGLRIEKLYFIRYSSSARAPWKAYAYDQQSWRKFEVGALDARPYLVFVVATRVPGSSIGRIPQQSLYHERWNADLAPAREERRERLKRIVASVPGALALVRRIRSILLPRGRRALRFVGKY
jgi:SAM-dependent methyltransferase